MSIGRVDREGPKTVCVIIGTRPEAIKMAPVIKELKRRGEFSVRVISTGQHSDMLKQVLDFFSIEEDVSLGVMRSKQSLDYITSSVLLGVGEVLDSDRPDAVLVHGDTTTTFSAALAAFYRRIPIGHVEAGLRSNDLTRPFPEEMNRIATDRISSWWFAPTELARANLAHEGIGPEGVSVTGNTVVDALQWTKEIAVEPSEPCMSGLTGGAPFILLTAHRRESWGEPLVRICNALVEILRRHDSYRALVPMHKNPVVRSTITRILSEDPRIILCDPLNYPDFVWALNNCGLILSDSGGVQEEATALRKPVLILRDVTERPEAVEYGSGILVGSETGRITDEACRLLGDRAAYAAIADRCAGNPFGDGKSSARIADVLSAAIE
ncbi:MAG: UDP-N-acetylglucosamine 2-epimerase (non-hydrolyzing) [Synergistaceae bacterium]|nr:UDP-N-acetylglucosamine 2-epimerase (non-hydrolyzing) [Synergistaceae bacterium]